MKKNNYPTRGIRNCNPLNIRYSSRYSWQGQTGCDNDGFCRFRSMLYGIRAAFALLRTYNLRYKCTTIRQIISKWAPPTENHTEIYIAHICNATRMTEDTQCLYSGTEGLLLLQAMAVYESQYIAPSELMQQAQNLVLNGQ